MDEKEATEGPTGSPTGVRTFLIADLRGYTRFTDEHGDEAAAQLTTGFLALAREAVSSRFGEVVEVRGDEVLAVFDSPREAIRAALDLVTAVETTSSPELPMLVGIGLDAGEAVPVDGGYRGMALNMAARLCAKARPGEILVTPELAHLAGSVPGLAFEEREAVRLKGLSRPIRLHAVITYDATPRAEGADAHHGSFEFNVLGPVEVLDGGRPIPLGGPKQRLVLALLILQADRVVPMERLIDDLWGDDPPAAARNTIQSYVSHLRNALGAERIESKAPGYVLHAEPDEIDVLRFERLLRRARRHVGIDPAKAVPSFDEALSLWRGPPLADLADQSSLAAVASRLEDLRLGATEDLIGVRLALGEHATVIADLEALIANHPLRERSWGALMLAQYRAGRQGEALETFGNARTLLADELGVDPSSELRELHERMLKQDPSLELKGRALRSYRLIEQIGEGAFGVVWRAIDPGVGREVAVKQIQPRLADDPAFVRRFEQEAQSVARIEHPYVVPLYDYWRDGGGAYLVMRLMRGGSLAGSIERGPLTLETASDVIDHVAAALAVAHRLRLVHRDVRPENVLLDEDGSAYLSDFGLADDQTSGIASSSGSSGFGFRSPEQLRGEGATPRSDIYALGMLLSAILAGRQIPPGVDEIIARATAQDPADRYADAGDVAKDFRSALHAGASRIVDMKTSEQARNPYKGLRPFSEADAGDFFGRTALVDRLVERLAETGADARFLAVVGPSGGGKSSAVRAGLLPALRAGATPGSARWFYAEMLPGSRPMEELEAALLRVASDPPASLLEILDRDQYGLTQAIDRVLLEPDAELLLVVDQFEEIFTLVAREEDRVRFLECLVATVTEPGSRIRIVATLRADFYDRPLAYPGLAELIRARTETVVPLSSEELERAIVGPAEAVGATAELSLVAEVVGDVTDQPGALPLMQYALTETFDRRREGVLTLEAYREAGGVTGAIARRAEELLTSMNQAGREAARQLFLRLVTIGEGSEDTRRLVSMAELGSLEVDPDAMGAVIEVFGRHRLLSFDRDPDTRGPTVEVAHEALLREWGRLRGWIDAAREDVIMHRRLAAEVEEWERSARDPSFLLRGSRLTQFEGWFEGSALALSGDERRYIEESARNREVERVEDEARATRERALERRSRTRLRAFVAVLMAAVVVASALTVVAAGQRGRAQRVARVAQARELAAAAVANLGQDSERSVLLAMQAVNTTRATDGTVLPEAEEALHRAVQADRLLLTIHVGNAAVVRFSPDGSRILTPGRELGTAQVFDSATGKLLLTLRDRGARTIYHVNYSPDGRFISTSGPDASTEIWDAMTGAMLHRLTLPSGDSVCCNDYFSPDGSFLAAAVGTDGTTRVWDTATGQQISVIDALGPLSFSPDGEQLWVDSCVGDWRTPKTWPDVCVHPGNKNDVTDVSWSGAEVATSMTGSTVILWNAATGRQVLTLVPGAGFIRDIELAPDGRRLAMGFGDGTASVWDLTKTGATLAFVLAGHAAGIQSMKFNSDGSRLATASEDGTIKVWDVTSEGGGEEGTQSSSGAVAYGATGSWLAVGRIDGSVSILDATDGRLLRTLPGPGIPAVKLAADPTGTHLAVAWRDGEVGIWDPVLGREIRSLRSPDPVDAMALSPDGSLLVTLSGGTQRATVWEVESGERIHSFHGLHDVVAFSPDGGSLAGIVNPGFNNNGDAIVLWDVRTWSRLRTLHLPDWSFALDFDPTRNLLLTAGLDGTIRGFDTTSWRQIPAMTGNLGQIYSIASSPDGTLIATGSQSGLALWDVRTGRMLLALSRDPITRGASDLDFSPDGSRLVAPVSDGVVTEFLLRIDDLLALARSEVTRGLSAQECRQFLHLKACPASLGQTSPTSTTP